jgi:hypothetical protein
VGPAAGDGALCGAQAVAAGAGRPAGRAGVLRRASVQDARHHRGRPLGSLPARSLLSRGRWTGDRGASHPGDPGLRGLRADALARRANPHRERPRGGRRRPAEGRPDRGHRRPGRGLQRTTPPRGSTTRTTTSGEPTISKGSTTSSRAVTSAPTPWRT